MRTTICFLLALCAGLLASGCATMYGSAPKPQRLTVEGEGKSITFLIRGYYGKCIVMLEGSSGERTVGHGYHIWSDQPYLCFNGRAVEFGKLPVGTGAGAE